MLDPPDKATDPMVNETPEKLYALPMEQIPTCDGVIIKRGCAELRISGSHVAEVIRKVCSLAAHPTGITLHEICEQFAPSDHHGIETLIEQLLHRRFLVTRPNSTKVPASPESNIDIFYWHFDTKQTEVVEQIGQKRIAVLGVNEISRYLVKSLSLAGFQNLRIIDHPMLRNSSLFDEQGNLSSSAWTTLAEPPSTYAPEVFFDSFDCFIATSDFGITPTFHEMNKRCVQHRRHFFPVVLHNMIGYAGPLVIPGETACYDCLYRRMSSHLEEPEMSRATEHYSFVSQRVVSFHPLIISVLADIAAFDLLKFYSAAIEYETGMLLEIRLLALRMTTRKVLKLPRCPTCSPMMTRPSITLKKSMFTFRGPDA